ncbi:predicted protein [Histoplasma capsulatum var. duboisii H88]|uniref:Predicted protein n=1 Tax=Ajellomyces capsulatus (strain H88) TaxID=544711 RepID=F0UKM1_AJEC8|nr:predicted protein [Histoplasma capsulatum var. duboisii H88]
MWSDDEGGAGTSDSARPEDPLEPFLACNDIFSLIQEEVLDVPEHDASSLKSLQGCSPTRAQKFCGEIIPKSDGPCVTPNPAEDKLFEREMGFWDDEKGG